MKIQKITYNTTNNNSYIVYNEDSCVVIDPSFNADGIITFIKNNNLKLEAILLTHCHFDHISTSFDLARELDTKIYCYTKERDVMLKYNLAHLFNSKIVIDESAIVFFNEKKLSFNNLVFGIFETPGHTQGGICIEIDETIFTGDTLFKDSIGRMDLPTSSPADLAKSISFIFNSFNENYTIMPGHGESDYLKNIKANNLPANQCKV